MVELGAGTKQRVGTEKLGKKICVIYWRWGREKEGPQHVNCCRAEYETGALYSEKWRGAVKSSS